MYNRSDLLQFTEQSIMLLASIVATLILISALFYHQVSLRISSVVLLLWTAGLAVVPTGHAHDNHSVDLA